jgi:nucleotide-binding universal stress UspA family protein
MFTSASWRLALHRKKIFHSILFPVDFSDSCKATAVYVRDFAQLTGGTVTLLHVVPWRPAWYGAADVHAGTDGHETLRSLRKVQMSALERFGEEYFNGVPSQIRIESGSVDGQIVDYAQRSGIDLIMMPTRGTGRWGRHRTGSVTAAVLRDASCAVWTSPHCDRLKPFTGFSSIVCAIAPTTILAEYVNETAALGAFFGSRVTFASAIEPARASGEEPRILTVEEEYTKAGLEHLITESTCGCPVYVEPGPVGYVVRHIAQIQDADLVVINRRHTPEAFNDFESHADEIILESPCPVLSLPIRAMVAPIHIAEETYAQHTRAFAVACC